MDKIALQNKIDRLIDEKVRLRNEILRLECLPAEPKRYPNEVSSTQQQIQILWLKIAAIDKRILFNSCAVKDVTRIVREFVPNPAKKSVHSNSHSKGFADWSRGYKVYPGRILIVGDNEVLQRHNIARMLKHEGFDGVNVDEVLRPYIYEHLIVNITYSKVIKVDWML